MEYTSISQLTDRVRYGSWRGVPSRMMTGPRWVYEWALLLLILSLGPYAAGLILSPEGSVFSGNLLNYSDTNSYFASMQLGRHGYWLYQMPYSAQSNQPLPLFSLYLLLGHLARLT